MLKIKGSDCVFVIKKETKRTDISRTIRFSDDMFKRLQTISQNEDVSFNWLVLQCCEYALNEYGSI